MSYSELAQAISELKKVVSVSGRDDLLRQSIVSTAEDVSTRSLLLRWVMDLVDGGVPVIEMIKKLSEYELGDSLSDTSALSDLISIHFADDSGGFLTGDVNKMTGEQTNEGTNSQGKDNTSISLIQVKTVEVTPGSRLTDACSMLMNTIPSYEWSRAVPFLNITLLVSRPVVDDDGTVTALSLGRFLVGSATVDGIERSIVEASEFNSDKGDVRTATGMEIFTAPQILVNANEGRGEGGESVRTAPILDVFRPLMSIRKFELNIVSMGAGAIPYKHGNLQLVLHDRSRLGEIADLVRPDLYSATELMIEYGWSHPDGGSSSTNPFGKLINASRVREKYGIKNSQFSFEEGGQVEIALELVTKGITDLAASKISETKEVIEATKTVEKLTEAVADIRRRVINTPTIKEIGGVQLLDSTSDLSRVMNLSPELKKQVYALINKKGATSSDTAELIKVLTALLGSSGDGSDGAVNTLITNLEESFKVKKDSLSNGVDYPLAELKKATGHEFESPTYVSLGKILLQYMGVPLAASGRFDEVQIITYCFNSGCGAMRNANVGSLPIRTSEFSKQFEDYVNARNRFNLTIREFLDYVVNNFVDNIANPAYGLVSTSRYSIKYKRGELINPLTLDELKKDQPDLYDEIQQSMIALGIPDGEFYPPKISFFFESVPRTAVSEVDVGDDGYTLLRIHIFDEVATPYGMYIRLLEAMKDRSLGTIGVDRGTMEDTAKHQELAKDVLKMAEQANLLEKVGDAGGVYKFREDVTPRRIKKFVADRVPYIRYGTSATGVKRASLRSIHDALLSTDHMQRMGLGDPSVAPGVDGNIVPLRMLPTELQLETIGCPFFNYVQQYFIDMDTGTTVDNIYSVVGATYTFEQGRFDTSVKLINMQAYGTFRSAVSSLQSALEFLEAEQRGF